MDKSQYGRRDRLVKQQRHDTYKQDGKWPEPTCCATCGSVYTNGRWTWSEATAAQPHEVTCPACRRISENFPAGYLELKGEFYHKHRDEITNLINNEEKLEKGEYPLERIMTIAEESEQILITTTGVHLAHRLGKAISRAYQGDLSFTYGDGEKTIRVSWTR